MLKQVTYSGFESRPELRSKVERLTPAVEAGLGTAADRIALEWRGTADGGTVETRLSDEWAGAGEAQFSPGELGDSREVVFKFQKLHAALLDEYLSGLVKRMRTNLAEAVER